MLIITTLAVETAVYGLLWHNQPARTQKEEFHNPEQELRWRSTPRRHPTDAGQREKALRLRILLLRVLQQSWRALKNHGHSRTKI